MSASVPSNLPQRPTNAPSNSNNEDSGGLSLGATVGIGIGIALVVILGAVGAWIFVRRRRRTWAQKRKEQGDPEAKGETPNEEISKKLEEGKMDDALAKEMRVDGAVEIGDGEKDRVGLGDETKYMSSARPLSELHTESKAYEMSSAPGVVEIGEGNTFVAELEGSGVPQVHTLQPVGDGLSPKPLEVQKKAGGLQ